MLDTEGFTGLNDDEASIVLQFLFDPSALGKDLCSMRSVERRLSKLLDPMWKEQRAAVVQLNRVMTWARKRSSELLNPRCSYGQGVMPKEIALAISESILHPSSNVSSLSLQHAGIDIATADMLTRSIAENAALRVLNLSWNKLGSAGVVRLARTLTKNKTLKVLLLHGCEIGPYNGLAHALKLNATLKELGLESNQIGAMGAFLLSFNLKSNKGLQVLRLGNNDIGDQGAAALREALQVNAVLTELYLDNNGIGDEGASTLADGLKLNAVLNKLDLEGNDIGEGGASALIDGLKLNAVLSKLNLSKNRIGDGGRAAIQKAVGGKECFSIDM